MRVVFSMLGLLIALLVVGLLAKKQFSAVPLVPPKNAAAASAGVTLPATTPGASPQVQSQQIQQQIKQSVEAAMQQPRAIPEEP